MNFDTVMRLIGKWGGTLKFFPSDDMARIGIAEEIAQMAATEDQVAWLIGRLPKLHKEWPGMLEVRAVFCSKYKPKDGIETYSGVYLDGIPSEKETLPALPAAPVRQIEAGEAVSASPSIAATLSELVRLKDMKRTLKGIPPNHVQEIPVVRVTAANVITPTDIERAVQELRDKKAEAEIERIKAEQSAHRKAPVEAVNEEAAK